MDPLTFRAAVLTTPRAPLVIESVELTHLRPRDVLIRVGASGLCHTDLEVFDGTLDHPLPVVLGHEVAGVVHSVGAEVTRVAAGDHVVCSAAPTCETCFYCLKGEPTRCETVSRTRALGVMLDGQTRLTSSGRPVHQLMHIGGLAEYCVVPETGAVAISHAVGFDHACVIGCCVITGVAAATRGTPVQSGSVAVVLGCGPVGLNAIQGARMAGARTIVAVDSRRDRLAAARTFGASVCVRPDDDLVDIVAALTEGRGADHVFEAAGATAAIRVAPELARPGGTVAFLGKVPADQDVAFRWGALMGEKRITRLAYGDSRPKQDFPWLAQQYLDGNLELDALITRRISLDDVNDGIEDMRNGVGVRIVVEF